MSIIAALPRRAARTLLALAAASAFLAAAAAAEPTYHVLAKGETLYSIARSYGIAPEEIAKANSIADPARLLPGTRLLIPRAGAAGKATGDQAKPAESPKAAVKHEVAKGETLFSIAREYGVGVEALRAANKLGPSGVIKSGDVLAIPAGGRPSGDADASAALPSGAASGNPPGATSAAPQAQPVGAPNAAGPEPQPQASPAPPMPDAVRTSAKPVPSGLSWPCPGDILYLEGKAFGVVIRAKLSETERAVATGTVSSAGPYRGYGNLVLVIGRAGYVYAYGGNETVSVRAGDRVAPGQALGSVGMDAKQGCPAAYFLVFKDGEAVDPAKAPRD